MKSPPPNLFASNNSVINPNSSHTDLICLFLKNMSHYFSMIFNPKR